MPENVVNLAWKFVFVFCFFWQHFFFVEIFNKILFYYFIFDWWKLTFNVWCMYSCHIFFRSLIMPATEKFFFHKLSKFCWAAKFQVVKQADKISELYFGRSASNFLYKPYKNMIWVGRMTTKTFFFFVKVGFWY